MMRAWRAVIAWILVLGGACALFAAPAAASDTAPRFDRDILPILAENCFACHGPDAANRQADLRLDTAEGATADRDGARAIVPGNPQASELITRVHSTDTAVVMPPPESNKRLTAAEKVLLEEWIKAGAPREAHWAGGRTRRAGAAGGDRSHRSAARAGGDRRLRGGSVARGI